MPRPAMAARVSSTKPASFNVSVWMASWAPLDSHTVRQASMAAGVAPQSSWILKPTTPARSWSRIESVLTVLPLPSSPMLTGEKSSASKMRARCQAPGVIVVALVPSAGPVPPPTKVVIPDASASSTSCGQTKWTWASMPPAVRILPLPAMISVSGPMTRRGWTPSIVSGLPALPIAVTRPSRMPMSALTTPQWSSTTAPVITVSGAPSARVSRDWPMDSLITLPPPKTASSPLLPGPPDRSRSTSTSRSVSASLIRSPVVGPNRSA